MDLKHKRRKQIEFTKKNKKTIIAQRRKPGTPIIWSTAGGKRRCFNFFTWQENKKLHRKNSL